VLGTQRRDAAAVLLAGLSASMSILWCDSRSERLFDATESVLGIGISGESPRNRTFHPWRSKCPYRRPTFQNPVNERIGLIAPVENYFRFAHHSMGNRDTSQ
jgi:hypothetical protein